MKTLFGYVGRLGSGKGYCMLQQVEQLKTTGNSIYLVSFADPIKQILRESFGLEKSGRLDIDFRNKITKEYVKTQICYKITDLLHSLNSPTFAEYKYKGIYGLVASKYEVVEDEFYNHVETCVLGSDVDFAFSFRRLGQLLGTEIGRYCLDTIWIDVALAKVTDSFHKNLAEYAFIDDCRFLNEFEALQNFDYCTEIIGVTCSDETRALRRKLSLEDLKAQDCHGSEMEIDLILEKLPDGNIINNEGN